MNSDHKWLESEIKLALRIYLLYPQGSAARKKAVQEMSERAGIKYRSLDDRVKNFESLASGGKRGLSHSAKTDKRIWSAYVNNPESVAYEMERLYEQLMGKSLLDKHKDMAFKYADVEGCEREVIIKQRTNQCYFREMILNNYANKCALSGINMPELLVASHIIPWKENRHRMDPENGICLSALYDKAFDRGFISFDNDYRCIMSPRLKASVSNDVYKIHFSWLENRMLDFPIIHKPNLDYLAWHREHVFVKR